ncbi:MAG: hypothetical protein Q9217_003032 [Psora testacea]
MAFNFKWSPLAADASFYTKAQELLTAALNKSPKPPIIVDDIIVNELNLGDIPPDLEVLEIGDLDVDRFRGIFKMCYAGNAYLTLKTRVQANPLNTYLSTKPSFTSPQPLAAASGLTIPIQITLSEIKLSAFIILVYSNQKGVTLVFRNDPLESLKVSSTFDAIPFVREYLQKEIEGQLRTLLMDELPLIIHRLSLRLFNKEHQGMEDDAVEKDLQTSEMEDKTVDPLASPPQDPVDLSGNVLDAAQIASLSLDPGSEMHALFSQKNLLRLGALSDSHRTLSLFTPSIRGAVFRAWAGPTERGEVRGSSGKATPALSRSQSYNGTMTTKYILSEVADGSQPARPTLSSFASAAAGMGTGSSKHTKPHGRKTKHRVINLRKKTVDGDDGNSISGDSATTSGTGTGGTGTMSSAPSEHGARPKTPETKEPGDADVGQTPPRLREATPRQQRDISLDNTPRVSQVLTYPTDLKSGTSTEELQRPSLQDSQTLQVSSNKGKMLAKPSPASRQSIDGPSLKLLDPSPFLESHSPSTGTGFEHAWMKKIAGEILRKVQDQKAVDSGFWTRNGRDEDPPPAYGT